MLDKRHANAERDVLGFSHMCDLFGLNVEDLPLLQDRLAVLVALGPEVAQQSVARDVSSDGDFIALCVCRAIRLRIFCELLELGVECSDGEEREQSKYRSRNGAVGAPAKICSGRKDCGQNCQPPHIRTPALFRENNPRAERHTAEEHRLRGEPLPPLYGWDRYWCNRCGICHFKTMVGKKQRRARSCEKCSDSRIPNKRREITVPDARMFQCGMSGGTYRAYGYRAPYIPQL